MGLVPKLVRIPMLLYRQVAVPHQVVNSVQQQVQQLIMALVHLVMLDIHIVQEHVF